jgi:hypothetical protein
VKGYLIELKCRVSRNGDSLYKSGGYLIEDRQACSGGSLQFLKVFVKYAF